MGTVLFTWELGGGLGHMMQIIAPARELRRRGHRVFVALRDLSRACGVFSDQQHITLLAAPAHHGPPANPVHPPHTFAHILHNVGYGYDTELAGLTAAWRGLFDAVRPDVVVFDHSPTALLASRGLSLRRVTLGAGFCCPPDQHPLPDLRPWQPADPQKLLADEIQLLDRMNRLLESRHQPTLSHIAQLYRDVDDTFLVTFGELDHYPGRPAGTRYRGVWNRSSGATPVWPDAVGAKIYCYLKNFPALPHLLEHLRQTHLPTLIFVDGIPLQVQKQFACPTLAFANERLEILEVARQCDVAILNANHATAAALLMAGKPLLQLPLYLEQGLLAGAVCRMGAGLQASPEKPQEIIERMPELLTSDKLRNAAKEFSKRHCNFDPVLENAQMVQRIIELIG